MSRYAEVVKLLLDTGLDRNERGWEGCTPLMLVHHPEITELLLQLTFRAPLKAFRVNFP